MTTAMLMLMLLAGDYKKEHDRFTNEETHYVRGHFSETAAPGSDHLYIAAFLVHGKEFKGAVSVGLLTAAREWRYLDCHAGLYILLDGERLITIKNPKHSGKVMSSASGVIETVSARVPVEDIVPIMHAKKSIELKICNDERRIPLSFAEDVRKFLTAIGHLRAPQPVSSTAPTTPPNAPPKEPPSLETAPTVFACLQANAKESRAKKIEVCGWTFEQGRFTDAAEEGR